MSQLIETFQIASMLAPWVAFASGLAIGLWCGYVVGIRVD